MISGLKSTLFLLLTAGVLAKGSIGPVATLTIGHKDISPDGFTRNAVVVNGVTPAPLITAKKGEKFKLNVVNQLADPHQERGTSIHWHGLLQRGTNFMDGVAGVTQCPIAPGHSFEYTFNADHPGTFWYHSHFGLQYCDGLRGPIVIYDPEDPLKLFYDVDDDSTVITLGEWYHITMADHHGIEFADSTLINGKGRIPGGPKVDLAVVNVQKGKRYRLRILSLSCEPTFLFSVDGHDLKVIEVEGTAVWPVDVTHISLLAAQRYSAVLKADQPVGNYWIRSIPNEGNLNLSTAFEGGINAAILRYKGAPIAEPTSSPQQHNKTLKETDLHSMFELIPPGRPTPNGADVTVNLTLAVDLEKFIFTINGVQFQPPEVPVLLQILSGARDPRDLLPSGGVITLPRNQVVQINVPSGLFGGPHPFHMHGHAFSVVRSADTGHFNFLDPVVRDVVDIGANEGDFIAIRFKTDNPGPWIFHCHIDFHLAVGLAIVFAEAPDQTPASDAPPASWKELCPIWDAEPDDVKIVSDGRPLP